MAIYDKIAALKTGHAVSSRSTLDPKRLTFLIAAHRAPALVLQLIRGPSVVELEVVPGDQFKLDLIQIVQ